LGKVVSLEGLILHRHQWKGNGQRLVFVAGCFDLLHPGHIRLLEQAHDRGEILAVGVLSDASVAGTPAGEAEAGANVKRPITPASERCEILAALAMVDFTFEFSDSELHQVIKRLAPDVVVEGSEPCASGPAIGEAAARAGIEVMRIPLEPGHSTSLLIERIAQIDA
jgi:D-glycero-beta-D-manno-heptose 1-phosphate adenylyltransferase